MARTDDDSWDLATGVGATATLVAAGRARAARAAQPLIDDPFAEPLVRAVGVEFLTRWATGELDAADVDDPDAAWGLQRMTTELVVRTRYFDQFFLDAAAAGVRQAVILASGLDARGYRLPWPADTTVFEVDQPRVLEFKAQTLAGLGAQPTADLRMVPADCVTIGPMRCAAAASMRPSRPRGSPRVCSDTFPRTRRIVCWTTSPT